MELAYAESIMTRGTAKLDQKLIQIVDKALAENVTVCGSWLACRPGCTQCCIGVFPINQLDAARLRQGLVRLEKRSPKAGERIRTRARDSVRRLSPDFPGNVETGTLDESPNAQRRFAHFGDDEVCPVLDPETGLCALYESRPMTCRVFGPPIRSEDGLGVCELCFQDAADNEIAACELVPDPDDLESDILKRFENESGNSGQTIIAFCLAR